MGSSAEELVRRIEKIVELMPETEKNRDFVEEIKDLKKDVVRITQNNADITVKLEVLTERFSTILSRYEELKEDVEGIQDKLADDASSSRSFRNDAMLVVIGGIVTYVGNMLINK